MLLVITVGSIYAADNSDSAIGDYQDDDDFEVDDDWEDSDDGPDEDDEGEDDTPDEDDSDEDDEDDEGEDDDFDEDDDDLDDDDWDEDSDDSNLTDYEFLEYKILSYLDQYGNCTDENWTESEDFINEYQSYLSDPSSYALNESAEGYQTYLKIYDSITSTFDDYNLTENETAYLKFLIIYYLNHYGNVSANYTWNESESFENFTPSVYLLAAKCSGMQSSFFESSVGDFGSNYSFYVPLTSFEGINNQTSDENETNVEVPYSGDMNIFVLVLLAIILVILVVI